MALITKGKSHAKGEYASMDLTSVVGTLESHWVVLDAELSEIRKDFNLLKSFTRKHGEFWNRPLAQLKKLRTQKENLLKEYGVAAPLPCCAARACSLLSSAARPVAAGSSSRWSFSTFTYSR